MAQNSSIEWTEMTWNPCAGCSAISPGCARCYALRMAHRLAAMGQDKYRGTTSNSNGKVTWTGQINLDKEALKQPSRWKEPRTIFVNSMSDLFHENVSLSFILRSFMVMQNANWHRFQVLTKRSERLLELNELLPWTPNVWMGCSVENASYTHRIDHLRHTGAEIKFLSLEPLLGPLPNLNLEGIDWVIAGGESGPGARPMDPAWVIDIRDQCAAARVPFFFKQFGKLSNNPNPNDPTAKRNGGKAKGGRLLEGRTWDEMPEPKTEGACTDPEAAVPSP